jgi:hypothetical protein
VEEQGRVTGRKNPIEIDGPTENGEIEMIELTEPSVVRENPIADVNHFFDAIVLRTVDERGETKTRKYRTCNLCK